jgi:hypothetical protein
MVTIIVPKSLKGSKTTMQRTTARSSSWLTLVKLSPTTPCVTWLKTRTKTSLNQGHQVPLKKNDPNYKGSSYNVLVEWEDGSNTYEPLDLIIRDDPVTLAIYAKKNKLLNKPVWKRLKHVARNLVSNKLYCNSMSLDVSAGIQNQRPCLPIWDSSS